MGEGGRGVVQCIEHHWQILRGTPLNDAVFRKRRMHACNETNGDRT